MKIQCDVCDKEEASVFCTADEAALCDGCDRRVHHANKLASKHPRFSLLHPDSPNSVPLCDICQEKRAFLFCQQDRAILCRECDGPIHTANDLTLKHSRFLLTGVKLSAIPYLYADSGDVVPDHSSSAAAAAAAANNIKSHQPPPPPAKKPPAASLLVNTSSTTTTATTSSDNNNNNNCPQAIVLNNNCSTISEYLMETLPGWHVEDLLDTTAPSAPFGFSKVDDGMLSFGETDYEAESNISNKLVSSSSERLCNWVPQAPPTNNFLHPQLIGFNNKGMLAASNKETAHNYSFKTNRRWTTTEDLFAVPQIIPPSSIGSKRSRPF